jgi:hypothetical protein
MLAGAAEAVITCVKDRPAVYDDLFARALVLGADDDRLAIVAADMGTFSVEYADELVRRIERTTDIPSGNIIITTTQTHNAPGVDGREMTPEAGAWLSDCIAGLVQRASHELRPCALKAGRAPVQIGYNRRLMQGGEIVMAPNPDGAIVPWVDVLEAKDADGRRIAALFSHAAHPVIVHWLSEEIGPDFPGYAVMHLRALLAREGEPEGVFMFAQGCCGDINGHPLRGGFGACEAAGLSLAFAVTRALADARPARSKRARSICPFLWKSRRQQPNAGRRWRRTRTARAFASCWQLPSAASGSFIRFRCERWPSATHCVCSRLPPRCLQSTNCTQTRCRPSGIRLSSATPMG